MLVLKNILSSVFLFSMFFISDVNCINTVTDGGIIVAKSLIDGSSKITLLVGTPDGDAVSAAAALSTVLLGLNKSVETIYNGNLAFNFARQPKNVLIQKHEQTPDLLISLDEADKKNLYWCEDFNGVPLINIDHHDSNDLYGNLSLINTDAAACCEVLISVFAGINTNLFSSGVAESLVFGIWCDTQGGNERLLKENTLPSIKKLVDLNLLTFEAVSQLEEEYKKVIDELTDGEAKLWENLKDTIKTDVDLSFVNINCFFDIPRDGNNLSTWVKFQRKFFGLEEVKTSKLQAFIYLIPVGLIRNNEKAGYNISLRSNNGEALKVAKSFGGGGHYNAASFFVAMDSTKSFADIINKMKEVLNKID